MRLFSILFLAAACSAAAAESDADAVLRLKRELVQAYVKSDVAALDRIYSDDYVVTDAKGVTRTKASELERVRKGGSTMLTGEYDAISTRILGDVAILYGRGHMTGRGPDGPWENRYESTNVFERRNGRWYYVAAFVP
jgi:ketosteroid isomerase-like protein